MKSGTKQSPGKRKREAERVGQPSKKVKQTASIAELEAALLEPDAPSLNPLSDLLVHARSQRASPADVHAAIFALYRVFVSLVSRGLFAPGSSVSADVKTWLYARLDEFTSLLALLLRNDEDSLRKGALQILFSLLKYFSESLSAATNSPQVQPYIWRTTSQALLGTNDLDLGEYLKYDDIRWFFLRDMTLTMRQEDRDDLAALASNALHVLDTFDRVTSSSSDLTFFIPPFGRSPSKAAAAAMAAEDSGEDLPDDDDWRTFFDKPAVIENKEERYGRTGRLSIHARLHAPPAHRAQFVRAWLAVLSKIGTEGDAVRALSVLHVKLVPHLKKEEAVRTMDWIAGCVDYGGTTGLLALNTLFELMTTMNLEYPDLYVRLYGYLDRNILHLKHRARFFRIVERMLSSTHLPATLVASFIKRLGRLSLYAPPAAVVSIVALTYNLFKQHPTCMVLIHRDEIPPDQNTDPYDPIEPSPLKTRALDSSLWELQSHVSHFHAPTATLARVFSEPFTKPSYALEDFLDHSYSTMFDAETGGRRGRKIKVPPAVLDEHDTIDLVKELWVC